MDGEKFVLYMYVARDVVESCILVIRCVFEMHNGTVQPEKIVPGDFLRAAFALGMDKYRIFEL